MIQSKNDLKYYLKEDLKRFDNKKPNLKDWILHNEVWYIYRYIKNLRYLEYYLNTNKKLSYLFHFFLYKKMCFKHKIDIKPNNV